MRLQSLYTRLLTAFLAVALLVVAGFVAAVVRFQGDFSRDGQRQTLAAMAAILRAQVGARMAAADPALQEEIRRAGTDSGVRLTLVARDGRVLADSHEDPAAMENHAARPEVVEALAGRTGAAIRVSATVKLSMHYVAVPAPAGVVRVAAPTQDLAAALSGWRRHILALALAALAAAALASHFVARRLVRPLQEMQEAARRFAVADLAGRVPVPDTAEFAELARTLNTMAGQLGEKIAAVEALLAEQRALFAGLADGLLVVGEDEVVTDLNRVAGTMLGTTPEQARGRHVLEAVRNPRLRQFIQQCLDAAAVVESDLVLYDTEERCLQLRGAAIPPAGSAPRRAVILLSDVTRLRALERVRRDFVANASHELKTPMTSIRGYAETLEQMNLSDPDARRFVEVIVRQSEQMSTLIDDLLELTRTEHLEERGSLEMGEHPVADAVETAVAFCRPEAEHRRIALEIAVPGSMTARFDPGLLPRALANLIENAVKYSREDSRVEIEARAAPGGVEIEVRDQGVGIAEEHQRRIFERFYRVDKARSRKLGGTGLGLAIVRHIVHAHGGRISLQSRLGEGSTFTIFLPVAPPAPA
jgi:two-component system phosphate regulon sensor histidine kinase PhoR